MPLTQELTTMSVTVTETAAREISSIIKQQELDPESIRLRVGVKGGGCSGFSYLLDLTETQRDTDEEFDFTFTFPKAKAGAKGGEKAADASGNGSVAIATDEGETFTLRVICDQKSLLYLNGTVIDFKDEIMGRGFVFSNPNATATCGCGSSFSA
jgi:iron-sulfur cluster assembly protein